MRAAGAECAWGGRRAVCKARAPGLPTLKGPRWSLLSITATMPGGREGVCAMREGGDEVGREGCERRTLPSPRPAPEAPLCRPPAPLTPPPHTRSLQCPSPRMRSVTYWKERVCLPSPNSVSGSPLSACVRGARACVCVRAVWRGEGGGRPRAWGWRWQPKPTKKNHKQSNQTKQAAKERKHFSPGTQSWTRRGRRPAPCGGHRC